MISATRDDSLIRSTLWAPLDDSEAHRNPVAEQIGDLMGDGNLVSMLDANLAQDQRDSLY